MKVMPKTRRQLERRGTRFANYFATHPVCCPSRATLLSGQYSHNHGVLSNNKREHGGFSFFNHRDALPVWLDKAGYATAHVGKYMNGTPKDRIPPGWDEWNSTFSGATEQMYGYSMNHNGKVFTYGDRPRDYQTDVQTRIATKVISEWAGDGAPFYLHVDTMAPHVENVDVGNDRNPRVAPRHAERFLNRRAPRGPAFNEADVSDKPEFLQREKLSGKRVRNVDEGYRDRLASLLAVDDLVARVMKALRRKGVMDETIVMFTSDNGYLHGEHRFGQGKRELWEPSVRVPMLVRGPGFRSGYVVRQLTGNIDIAPTLLEAGGGVAEGVEMDGVALQPLVADRRRLRNRTLVFENGVHGSTGVRTKNWVFIDHRKGRELYDLRRDPHQLRSLIGSDRPRIRRVQRKLVREWRNLRDCAGPAEC